MPTRNVHPLTYVLIGLAAFWISWVYGLISDPDRIGSLVADWTLIIGAGVNLSIVLKIFFSALFGYIEKKLFNFPLRKTIIMLVIVFCGVITGALTKTISVYTWSLFT